MLASLDESELRGVLSSQPRQIYVDSYHHALHRASRTSEWETALDILEKGERFNLDHDAQGTLNQYKILIEHDNYVDAMRIIRTLLAKKPRLAFFYALYQSAALGYLRSKGCLATERHDSLPLRQLEVELLYEAVDAGLCALFLEPHNVIYEQRRINVEEMILIRLTIHDLPFHLSIPGATVAPRDADVRSNDDENEDSGGETRFINPETELFTASALLYCPNLDHFSFSQIHTGNHFHSRSCFHCCAPMYAGATILGESHHPFPFCSQRCFNLRSPTADREAALLPFVEELHHNQHKFVTTSMVLLLLRALCSASIWGQKKKAPWYHTFTRMEMDAPRGLVDGMFSFIERVEQVCRREEFETIATPEEMLDVLGAMILHGRVFACEQCSVDAAADGGSCFALFPATWHIAHSCVPNCVAQYVWTPSPSGGPSCIVRTLTRKVVRSHATLDWSDQIRGVDAYIPTDHHKNTLCARLRACTCPARPYLRAIRCTHCIRGFLLPPTWLCDRCARSDGVNGAAMDHELMTQYRECVECTMDHRPPRGASAHKWSVFVRDWEPKLHRCHFTLYHAWKHVAQLLQPQESVQMMRRVALSAEHRALLVTQKDRQKVDGEEKDKQQKGVDNILRPIAEYSLEKADVYRMLADMEEHAMAEGRQLRRGLGSPPALVVGYRWKQCEHARIVSGPTSFETSRAVASYRRACERTRSLYYLRENAGLNATFCVIVDRQRFWGACTRGENAVVNQILKKYDEADNIQGSGSLALIVNAVVESQGLPPLAAAAIGGRTSLCKLLLERHADPFITNECGFTSLMALASSRLSSHDHLGSYARQSVDTSIAGLLFQYSVAAKNPLANDEAEEKKDDAPSRLSLLHMHSHARLGKSTPLHYAVTRGKHWLVSSFLDHGRGHQLDPPLYNVPNGEGATALHIACTVGHLTIVRLLLNERNINVNAQNCSGVTPLGALCARRPAGCEEICIALLAARAVTDSMTRGGYTPLHILAAHVEPADAKDIRVGIALASVLIRAGANRTLRTADGYLPSALWKERMRVTEALGQELDNVLSL